MCGLLGVYTWVVGGCVGYTPRMLPVHIPGHDPYMSGDLGVFGAVQNSDPSNP